MRVLGIETSCDETGLAIYDSERGIIGESLYSQVEMHRAYGGVVPELASRDHLRRLAPLLRRTLAQAKLSFRELDGIAYTAGPGLIGALLTGACLGRTLAWVLSIPVIGVHHMEGHLLSVFLQESDLKFPFVALLVSGGHTQLVLAKNLGQYELLGQTLDDAAGEAFDKTARLLGLGYPGGAALSALANRGQADKFHFPHPMRERGGELNFSFSGLKTCVAREVESLGKGVGEQEKADIALAFEQAIVGSLVEKCKTALCLAKVNKLVISGGVAANRTLRKSLEKEVGALGGRLFAPSVQLCTDNGAMIAYAGYCRIRAGQGKANQQCNVRARWSLGELEPMI